MNLRLDQISLGAGTQTRAAIDETVVGEYAEQFDSGAKFPPIVVFHDGADYFLADGFHRFHAAAKCGMKSIAADVRQGTRSDALIFALGANVTHGLKRTNADKRKCVTIALREFPDWSDRRIAETCGVNHEMVGSARSQLADSATSDPTPPTPRTGKDGKKYPPTRSKGGASEAGREEDETSPPPEAPRGGGTLSPPDLPSEEAPSDKYPEAVRALLWWWKKARKAERAMFCQLTDLQETN